MTRDESADGTLLAAPILFGIELLARCGVDVDAVFHSMGMSRDVLAAPAARIPASWEHQIWQAIETAAGDCAVGLRIAEQYVLHGLPTLEGYLSRNASSLRSTLLALDRFARIADTRLRLPLSERGALASLRVVRDGIRDRAPGFVECLFASMVGFTHRYVCGLLPTRVHLRRAKPPNVAPYRAAYGVVPRFGSAHSEIIFPRAALDLPVQGADPSLSGILETHATRLVAELPKEDPFLQRIRALLTQELRAGRVDLGIVAARMALSERTLRRRLNDRQTSLKRLLDEVRRDLACQLLAEGQSVSDIAERVGFHGPRALQKAFVRWTQLTPAQYRRR